MASCKQPTTAYSLWHCACSGTVHAVASSFASHRGFTATHRSPRAQPMRHRLTTSFFPTQCKESCAVAAAHNDGRRSISPLSARSTARTRWNNWRRGWFSASNPNHWGLQYTYRQSNGNLRASLWHMQPTTACRFGNHDPGPNEVASLLVSESSALR